MEKIFFTIVDPVDAIETETKLHFEYDEIGGHDGIEASPVYMRLGDEAVRISPQQLTELAALLLSLAGTVGVDYESADVLLEGFSLKGKSATTKLAEALEE